MHRNRLTNPIDIQTFLLGGNATFTLLNANNGNRFTFKIRQPKSDQPHFVNLLSGPDNTRSYTFLGTIFGRDLSTYRPSPKSSVGEGAPSSKAIRYLLWLLAAPVSPLPTGLEVWHEGRCCMCGRALTVPESIETGIGPVCAGRLN